MRKGLSKRKFNTVYIITVAFLYIAGLFLLISSKGIAVQGSDYPEGVHFSYKDTEYKLFMLPFTEYVDEVSIRSVIIPDDVEYRLVEEREFCEKYNLWTGRCDCDGKIGEKDGKVSFTMNWTGEPQEYTFNVYKYGNRAVEEVVYIADESGHCGYGYAANILTKDKR